MKNNNEIIGLVFIIFLAIGFLMPIITQSLNTSYDGSDYSQMTDTTKNGITANPLTWLDFLLSILGVFFFSFGSIPLFIEIIILFPLRIVFYMALIDKIRGHGS
jgi:hypothetical protein